MTVHANAGRGGRVSTAPTVTAHAILERLSPTMSVAVTRMASVTERRGAAAAYWVGLAWHANGGHAWALRAPALAMACASWMLGSVSPRARVSHRTRVSRARLRHAHATARTTDGACSRQTVTRASARVNQAGAASTVGRGHASRAATCTAIALPMGVASATQAGAGRRALNLLALVAASAGSYFLLRQPSC